MYQQQNQDAQFDVISPLNILSESVEALDLELLWAALSQVDFEMYRGVIITCGSDTIAYLSSFVGLLFPHRPIALACANRILTAPDSNGYMNFCAAVKVLAEGFSEVFVPYQNSDGVTYLHSATELRQADYADDLVSFYRPFAVFDGEVKPLGEYISHNAPDGIFSSKDPLKLNYKVAVISPYPLMRYDDIDISSFKAALHLTYHSGTLNSRRAKALMEKADKTPVYLAPLKRGAKPYQTTVDMLSLGMKPLYDVSPECAYMKLLLAVNQQKLSIDAFMEDET